MANLGMHIPAPGPDHTRDLDLIDLIPHLPQEVIDMIKEDLFETLFSAGFYYDLKVIHGRLNEWGGPYPYLIEQSREHFPWLEQEMRDTLAGRYPHMPQDFYQGNSAAIGNKRDHRPAERLRLMLERWPTYGDEGAYRMCSLDFTNKYDSVGGWTGVEMPGSFSNASFNPRYGHAPPVEDSQRIWWKAFTLMAKRTAVSHSTLVPEMANTYKTTRVYIVFADTHWFIFL
ncbi:MAG: hypothetical protein Q9169_003105 [Polycauliona sp. 2 TL-2023]